MHWDGLCDYSQDCDRVPTVVRVCTDTGCVTVVKTVYDTTQTTGLAWSETGCVISQHWWNSRAWVHWDRLCDSNDNDITLIVGLVCNETNCLTTHKTAMNSTSRACMHGHRLITAKTKTEYKQLGLYYRNRLWNYSQDCGRTLSVGLVRSDTSYSQSRNRTATVGFECTETDCATTVRSEIAHR